jgi:hypothetical protein
MQAPIAFDLDQWDYLNRGVLRRSRSSHICLTCEHFGHGENIQKHTVLACHLHKGLIPNGEHLTKKCRTWMVRREHQLGWCPEG